jgi:choline dehydrogenase-like flavoprotein
LFVRPPKADFDRWVALGNDEWSYQAVLPYFRKLENDRDFGHDHDLHGTSGPIPVSRGLEVPLHPISAAFLAACQSLGFPVADDKNRPSSVGVGRAPSNYVDGVRINTGLAYVLPALGRGHLTVAGDAFVHRVLVSRGRATGVEVERDGKVEVIFGDEIVLCCGAVKSPHVLMLSGLGPAAELAAQGIKVIADLPGVGKSFSDHPDVNVTYALQHGIPPRPGTRMIEVVLNLTADGSPFPEDLEIMCFPRTLLAMARGGAGPADLARRARQTVSALRAFSPRLVVAQARRRHSHFLANALQQQESRGDLTLVSPDPRTQPLLTYNYLSTALDRKRMRQALRTSSRIVDTPEFAELGARRTGPDDGTLHDDALLDGWARRNVITAIHMSGTAHFGPDSDPTAVVDQRCRVRHIDRLRVVDTSVFPTVTSRGTNAAAIMLAERVADWYG